jgi:error-prone DNA polymerase
MLPRYAELHCLSNFSFLRGASHPEELVERAHAQGYSALAITDECSLAGVVRAHLAACDAGLKLLIGSELTLSDGLKLVLIATDRTTYGDLAQLITRGRRSAEKGRYALTRDDVASLASRCLALWIPRVGLDAPNAEIAGQETGSQAESDAAFPPPGKIASDPIADGRFFTEVFGDRAYLAVELFAQAGDRARLARLEALARATGLIAVAASDAHMHVRARRALQDTLTAIRLKTPLSRCGYALFPNGERHLHSRARLSTMYPPALLEATLAVAERCTFSLDELRYEYPEEIVPPGETPSSWLRKEVERGLARRYAKPGSDPVFIEYVSTADESSLAACSPALAEENRRVHPGDFHLSSFSNSRLLCDSSAGLAAVRSRAQEIHLLSAVTSRPLEARRPPFRYPNVPPEVRALIEHELALIAELSYEAYFLTVHDIVEFARSKKILCQGRGSAANSAVCYALGITEVDPSRMSMLFERFISRERNEPPDIDVDFEHQRREEVMQYVYQKYGRDRAAIAATLITYRPKSAVRDVGKALGLDLAQVDRLSGLLAWWDGRMVKSERIREAGFDPDHPVIRRLIALTGKLMGFPRHLSQHVGGFVIGRGPVERMVPVENASMKDRTVIEWDKDDLDAMGLLKVDCLALGMLSAIRRALDMVSKFRGTAISVQDIPPEDPAVYEMIQRADTIGVFQIESRAQQSMLPRLKPRNFYDLVIEVAIVRPGPIQGGMVHPYLRRRQGLEPISYPSPEVKAVLERTLGVPIFQEQVMQLAIVAAGFTAGEADQLRRSMAAWRRRGGLEKFEQRLIDGMGARGLSETFARQIYQQILGFGEYGFPESHAASFALLVYISSWLKHYEPAAFTGALLNSQPMGFYAPAQLVQDARRHGVDVRPVDVTVSEWDCTLEGPHPRPLLASEERETITLTSISGTLETPGQTAFLGEVSGSIQPLAEKLDLSPVLRLGLRMISGLTEAAGLRIIAARETTPFASVADLAHRAQLDRRDLAALAEADALAALAGHRHAAMWDIAGVERLPAILAGSTFDEIRPALPEPTEGQDIVADYRRVGLTLRRHPLALLRSKLAERRFKSASEIATTPHGRLARMAGIVIGRQHPDTASGVIFVTLEDETGAVNVIVWRDVSERQRRELLGSRLMGVYGKVEREGIVVHLVAGRLVDLTPMLGMLPTRSRDFR